MSIRPWYIPDWYDVPFIEMSWSRNVSIERVSRIATNSELSWDTNGPMLCCGGLPVGGSTAKTSGIAPPQFAYGSTLVHPGSTISYVDLR